MERFIADDYTEQVQEYIKKIRATFNKIENLEKRTIPSNSITSRFDALYWKSATVT